MPEQQKSIGGIWVKADDGGRKYLSISLEVDGVKRNFVAFRNKYHEEGDNKPAYNILPPRDQKPVAPKPAPAVEPEPENDIPF